MDGNTRNIQRDMVNENIKNLHDAKPKSLVRYGVPPAL